MSSSHLRSKMLKNKLLPLILSLSICSLANANSFKIGISTSNFKDYHPYISLNITKTNTSKTSIFHIKENHHLYWGGILLGSGILLKSKSIKYLGGTIMVDDLIQHTFNIESPLHLLNNELGKYKMYRDFVNKF